MIAADTGIYLDLTDEGRVIDQRWIELPPVERVADRLADILLGADEILGLLREERAMPLLWMETEIRRLYNGADELMRKITD
jgi:hypothetical protein